MGRIKAVDSVAFGSRVAVVLEPSDEPDRFNIVLAAIALAKRGATLWAAKHALEKMLADGATSVVLPNVESPLVLADDLGQAGVRLKAAETRALKAAV